MKVFSTATIAMFLCLTLLTVTTTAQTESPEQVPAPARLQMKMNLVSGHDVLAPSSSVRKVNRAAFTVGTENIFGGFGVVGRQKFEKTTTGWNVFGGLSGNIEKKIWCNILGNIDILSTGETVLTPHVKIAGTPGNRWEIFATFGAKINTVYPENNNKMLASLGIGKGLGPLNAQAAFLMGGVVDLLVQFNLGYANLFTGWRIGEEHLGDERVSMTFGFSKIF